MKKIAIISTKGGVGKTTTSINLGHGLSLNGKRVILLDCDPQNNLAEIFDLNGEEGVSELMLGKRASMTEVRRNLFVIPSGGRRLLESEWEISKREGREKILSKCLEDLSNCDYVLCDCSSAMNLININALLFVDLVIIPVGMDYFSISGMKQTFELIKEVCQQTGHQIRLMGILATMFDIRTKISREIYQVLSRLFPKEMFKTIIHNNIRLTESPAFGKTIFEYDITCSGAQDYIKLTAEILTYDR
ncbi:MAG TPA: ParA family protein [archaeon]|nr:ParA family protein [archaeon]